MKKKFLFMAVLALLVGIFSSCGNLMEKSFPTLYVVNGTDYSVNVYCDNHFVATAGAHNNSGGVEMNNVSVNLPVYVEAKFYDSKGKYITSYTWSNYYFTWNKSYKMTLTKSTSSSRLVEL